MDVAEVGGELGELSFHVTPLAVPADEHLRCEPVPHVVKPRTPTVATSARGRTEAGSPGNDGEVIPGTALANAGAAIGQEEGRRHRSPKEKIPLLRVAT